MNPQTQSRGGWVASFIIVGAVLVLGLLAGLYYIKTSQIESASEPAATNDQEPSISQDQKTDSNEKKSKPQPEKSTDTDDDKSVTREEQATDQANTDQKDKSSDQSEADENKVKTEPNSELPTTGPGDVGAQFIALVALTISSVAFVQSRRGL